MVSIQKQIEITEYRRAMARRYGPKWKVKTFQYELSRLRLKQLKQEIREEMRAA